MTTESVQELRMEGAHALIQHLRQNPAEASRAPGDLAAQFGLASNFVENVLAQIRPNDRQVVQAPKRISPWAVLQGYWNRFRDLFLRITHKPIPFVIISTLVIFVLFAAGGQAVSHMKSIGVPRTDRIVTLYAIGVLTFLTLCGHLACYFRHAKARYTLYGGAIVWLTTSIALSVLVVLDPENDSGIGKLFLVVLICFGMAMVAGLYASLGSVFSVLGGWYKMKQTEDREDQMTRQELLQRYFELQTRLESGTQVSAMQFWEDWPIVRGLRRHPFLWAFGLGIAGATLQGVAASLFHIAPLEPNFDNSLGYFVCMMVITLLQVCGYLAIVFLSGGVWRAVLTSLSYSLGSIIISNTPIVTKSHFGMMKVTALLIGYQGLSAIWMAIFAGFVGLGAMLQQKAARDQSLQKGDQATLMGEMLRVQWRLSNAAGVICVMVVDVVKSTLMKQGADPLVVEYSFREYQDWIARTSQMFGGRVHSTAGDGAVVAFNSCEQAFNAARKVQETIDEFNRTSNRMAVPFQVRIGLHTGQVEGDLDQVQFTSVIDVAAHIEETAAPGGIAASDEVVAQLGQELFAPMARSVGGYPVYAVQN